MGDAYVCVNGPQGLGDGSSWANCKSLTDAIANATAPDTVHVRHHSLNHDGTPSGASGYSITAKITQANVGAYNNPFFVVGYQPGDAPVRTLDDDMPALDGAPLGSGDMLVPQQYSVYHGLVFKNGPNIAINTSAAYNLCHMLRFEAMSSYGIWHFGSRAVAAFCRADSCPAGIILKGNYGLILCCEVINGGGPNGLVVTGAYGTIVGSYIRDRGNLQNGAYNVTALNTVRGVPDAYSLGFGSTSWGLAFENLSAENENGYGYSPWTVAIQNWLWANTNTPGVTPVKEILRIEEDPQFANATDPDIGNGAHRVSAIADYQPGAWQAGSGGDGGAGGAGGISRARLVNAGGV